MQLRFPSYAESESVEVLCSNFTRDLTNAYKNAYPINVKNKKTLDIHKPYITSEINTLIRGKHSLQKKFSKYPITYGDEYRRLMNHVSNLLNRARASYYKSRLITSGSDMKKTWKLVSDILGCDKKTDAITEMIINDLPCDDKVSIVNHANEYFANIGSNLGRNFTDSSHCLFSFTEEMYETFSFESVPLEVPVEIVKSLNRTLHLDTMICLCISTKITLMFWGVLSYPFVMKVCSKEYLLINQKFQKPFLISKLVNVI